jgi:hypothetical protein
MNSDGSQLANAMMSIHALEMQRATACPDWFHSAGIERRRKSYEGRSRTLFRLGRFLVKIGQRLQAYGRPQLLPQGTSTVHSN